MVHALFSQEGCQRDGFWEVVGRRVFPFELSQTLPVGGGLLVPCSLAGPPVMKQPCKWLLWSLARVDGFSQRASPNSCGAMFTAGDRDCLQTEDEERLGSGKPR